MVKLLLLAAAAALVAGFQGSYAGCYSDVTGALTLNQTYIYNTNGYCYNVCSTGGYATYATSEGSQCWCGNGIPDQSKNSSSSNCNVQCLAWTDMCGGNSYWSLYLTGAGKVETVSGSSSASSSSFASSSAAAPAVSSSGTSIVVPLTTVTAGGSTVLVTPTQTADSATSSGAASSSSTSSKLSTGATAGIAVGVIVIVALLGLAAFFFWRRHRTREEEYTKADDFTSSFQPPAPIEKRVDQRLEPIMLDKRLSATSLADEQDYSRKILRVINPDDS